MEKGGISRTIFAQRRTQQWMYTALSNMRQTLRFLRRTHTESSWEEGALRAVVYLERMHRVLAFYIPRLEAPRAKPLPYGRLIWPRVQEAVLATKPWAYTLWLGALWKDGPVTSADKKRPYSIVARAQAQFEADLVRLQEILLKKGTEGLVGYVYPGNPRLWGWFIAPSVDEMFGFIIQYLEVEMEEMEKVLHKS